MAGAPRALNADDVAELIKVGLGSRAADLIIRHARVVNVFTEQVGEPCTVAVAHGRVAALGPEEDAWLGPDTVVFDAEGAFLIPGLIDAHTHLDAIFQMGPYAGSALAHGNTTAITETAMICGAWGIRGVRAFMADAIACPMRAYFVAPSLAPPYPAFETSAGLSFEDWKSIIERDDCLGIGETYWPPAIDGDQRVARQFAYAMALGKTIGGHAAGARNSNLTAYAAAGVTDCHESITVADALDRLTLGLAVQVREGFVRHDMAAVVPGLKDLPDTRLVMLVTDLADTIEMAEQGAMNVLAAKAVALGVNPARAVAWCSLNPARYFGLKRLGAVAPGYVADMALVQDLTDFKVRAVFLEGQQVAANGRLLAEPAPFEYPAEARSTMRCAAPEPGDFKVPASGEQARVRVIEVAGDTITKPGEDTLAVVDGSVVPDPSRDILKMAHINRHQPGVAPAVAFTRGWGLTRGALATTLIWDTCNLLVIGAGEEEMALAASRIVELGGGMVVVDGERVVAELAMPLAGVVSPAPLEEVNRCEQELAAAARGLGCVPPRPFLTAQCFCFTGLPFLRLTDKGLLDVRRRRMVEVVLDRGGAG